MLWFIGSVPAPGLGDGTDRSLSSCISSGVGGTESDSPVVEDIIKLSAGVRGGANGEPGGDWEAAAAASEEL